MKKLLSINPKLPDLLVFLSASMILGQSVRLRQEMRRILKAACVCATRVCVCVCVCVCMCVCVCVCVMNRTGDERTIIDIDCLSKAL